MSKVLGIDLGTTYSCVAYIDEFGKAVVLKNSEGEHTTPSVVLIESESNVIVGNEAKRAMEVEPERSIAFIKRKMGKEDDSVTVDGHVYRAAEISGYILKKIVKDANEELRQNGQLADGEQVRDVVITCPAYFGMNEREATKAAGELAGVNVLNIINEPTAAAISYGVANSSDGTVLIYDLGGGTFDITVMNVNNGNIKVICSGGNDQLGGKDWDEALINHVMERYMAEFDEDLSEDPEAIEGLYTQVEVWKKSLTSREKVNISVNGPAGRLREELTREEYEELTRHLLDRTKNLMDDCLRIAESKGYPMDKIDKILLVGGSSRMPQVARMIEEDYGKTPVLQDPDESVAKGAALFAQNTKHYNEFVENVAAKSGKTVEELTEENLKSGALDRQFVMASGSGGGIKMSVSNVLSRSYGLRSYNSEQKKYNIVNILMMNDELPAFHEEEFYTMGRGDGINIEIFETRITEKVFDPEDREPITDIKMTFKQAVPDSTPVRIAFALDNAGILHITAKELKNQSYLDTTFNLSNAMTEEEKITALRRSAQVEIE